MSSLSVIYRIFDSNNKAFTWFTPSSKLKWINMKWVKWFRHIFDRIEFILADTYYSGEKDQKSNSIEWVCFDSNGLSQTLFNHQEQILFTSYWVMLHPNDISHDSRTLMDPYLLALIRNLDQDETVNSSSRPPFFYCSVDDILMT